MAKVLIVDDSRDIAELIALLLKQEHIDSVICNNGKDTLKELEKNSYDLILLDIMMPDMNGIELCSKIRESVACPILFLSAKNQLVDKMLGYEIGGDDYITKPFDNTELLLKIKSYLRLNQRKRAGISPNILSIGDISLNKETYEVRKKGKRIDLTTREFELLRYLMENAGIVLSKEQIFDHVWGVDYGDIGTVAVHIKNLRKKLDDQNDYILTVWGYGYKFRKELDFEESSTCP